MTDAQRQTYKQRDRDREGCGERERGGEREREGDKQTDRQTQRDTQREIRTCIPYIMMHSLRGIQVRQLQPISSFSFRFFRVFFRVFFFFLKRDMIS